MADSDEDTPQLSAHALAALQEFYQEQAAIEQNLTEAESGNVDNFKPQENWVYTDLQTKSATSAFFS